ncbi:MAG: N-6 DNA methylase [Actinomycetota bacterium]
MRTTSPGRPPVPDGLDERLALAARALARADGVPAAVLDDDPWLTGRADVEVDDLEARADALGRFHQRALARADRLAGGVFHTPVEVGRVLADLALDALGRRPAAVLDPAAGGGALLLAAADALVDRGHPPDEVIRSLAGVEIDPLAASVATSTLRRWGWRHGLGWCLDVQIGAGDAFSWPADRQVDLLVANPPFGGRLRGPALPAPPVRVRARLGAYADLAAAFLVLADQLTVADGVVACFTPSSLLGARDAAELRQHVVERRRLAAVWVDPPPFDEVAIDPCAVVLGPPGSRTAALVGGERLEVEDPGPTWSAAASAVPEPVGLMTAGRLGDVTEVISPFRDEYYALADAVDEDGPGPLLITSGLIDPARSRWGRTTARIARRRFRRPTVVLDRVGAAGERWVERQRRPKVLVASQTRRIEAIADPDGDLVGITPVVAVVPHDGDPFAVLAVLLSPISTAVARRGSTGTGLTRSAIRVSGPALAALPLPADAGAWRRATERLRLDGAAALVEVEQLMSEAYGLTPDDALWRWWELARATLTPAPSE